MLGPYHILMTWYLNSRVPGFSVVWIYGMFIIGYQLILLIDTKWHLHATMGNMSIQLCLSGLRMHQLFLTLYKLAIRRSSWYWCIGLLGCFFFSRTKEEHQKHICMVFDRLAQFKYHIKCKKCELLSFLVTISWLLVLVLFRPRLMLSSSGYSQYLSRMYRTS